MKVGIVTFHWSDNYGAVLQAYALQTFLQKQGHKVLIVNYWPHAYPSRNIQLVQWIPEIFLEGCFSVLSVIGRFFPGKLKQSIDRRYKILGFSNFRNKRLFLTDPICNQTELVRFADYFDVLISGSDQVWNPVLFDQEKKMSNCYLLSFSAGKARKIAYAASIGPADVFKKAPHWKEYFSQKLKELDAISVREKSIVPVVQDLSGRDDVTVVSDPTMLLDSSAYAEICCRRNVKNPYLFNYVLHGVEEGMDAHVQTISQALGLQVIKCDACKSELLSSDYRLPTPTVWLSLIRDASFVVTNSFHGIVFCLIFNIPFIASLVDGKDAVRNGRILDMLSTVGLLDRVFGLGELIPVNIFRQKIDWCSVNSRITAFKALSIAYLKDQGLVKKYNENTSQ